MSTAATQDDKNTSESGKPALRLLKKYPHKGTNGDRYSEGLDFYKGYLWHTTKTGLSKPDPNNNFAVLNTLIKKVQKAIDRKLLTNFQFNV